MWRRTMGLLVLAVLVAVAAAGCGSSGQDNSAGAPRVHGRASDHHHPAGHGLLFLHHHRIGSGGSV